MSNPNPKRKWLWGHSDELLPDLDANDREAAEENALWAEWDRPHVRPSLRPTP
jgi:hypothetical protein